MQNKITYSDDTPNYSLLYFLSSAIVAIVFIIIFVQTEYVEKEGFNPSENGALLAQSFRILNGEVPHKDFISSKPGFSAIFHTVHFYDPLPLAISSRWFTVFQFFIFTAVWVFVLFIILDIKIKNRLKFIFFAAAALMFSFLLSLNKYNVFPRLGIDALFFAVTGIGIFLFSTMEHRYFRKLFFQISGLALLTIAPISRHNFLPLVLISYAGIFYILTKKRKFRRLALLTIFGLIPVILYSIYLISNHAFGDFILQTKFFTGYLSSGFIQYLKSFVSSKLFIFNFATLFLLAYLALKSQNWKYKNCPVELTETQRRMAVAIVSFYTVAVIFFSFFYFLNNSLNIISIPFELFWILFVLSAMTYMTVPLKMNQKMLLIAGVLVPWSSSVLSPENTPVFATGLIVSQILMLSVFLISKYNLKLTISMFRNIRTIYLLIAINILFIIVSIYGQKQVNFKERRSSELSYCLETINDEFGKIYTNKNTFEYYSEFMTLLSHLPDFKNNFVAFPSNPIVYPILNSRNPLPADRFIPSEVSGIEDELIKKANQILDNRSVYFIVDKFKNENIAFKLEERNFSEFLFWKNISHRLTELPLHCKYFRVYKSN